jgi:hypothetical protein
LGKRTGTTRRRLDARWISGYLRGVKHLTSASVTVRGVTRGSPSYQEIGAELWVLFSLQPETRIPTPLLVSDIRSL